MNTDSEQIVPGAFECPRCAFQLQSGTAGPTISNMAERCPNDGEILLQLTWRKHAENLAVACEQQVSRAIAAEAALKRIKLHCLTTKDRLPMALARIVRLCIDAGITQSYEQIEKEIYGGPDV